MPPGNSSLIPSEVRSVSCYCTRVLGREFLFIYFFFKWERWRNFTAPMRPARIPITTVVLFFSSHAHGMWVLLYTSNIKDELQCRSCGNSLSDNTLVSALLLSSLLFRHWRHHKCQRSRQLSSRHPPHPNVLGCGMLRDRPVACCTETGTRHQMPGHLNTLQDLLEINSDGALHSWELFEALWYTYWLMVEKGGSLYREHKHSTIRPN